MRVTKRQDGTKDYYVVERRARPPRTASATQVAKKDAKATIVQLIAEVSPEPQQPAAA